MSYSLFNVNSNQQDRRKKEAHSLPPPLGHEVNGVVEGGDRWVLPVRSALHNAHHLQLSEGAVEDGDRVETTRTTEKHDEIRCILVPNHRGGWSSRRQEKKKRKLTPSARDTDRRIAVPTLPLAYSSTTAERRSSASE